MKMYEITVFRIGKDGTMSDHGTTQMKGVSKEDARESVFMKICAGGVFPKPLTRKERVWIGDALEVATQDSHVFQPTKY